MLNVIDISNHQAGLDLGKLYADNPSLAGVICKATGSTWFVDEYCDPWIQWLIANGRPWGFYHFLCDGNWYPGGKKEAEYFVENTRNYFGRGTVWADYEFPATMRGAGYLKAFLDRVYELTGVKPGVYCSLSIVKTQGFREIAAAGYPFWLAQYADDTTIYDGFTDHPWQSGSVSPFDRYVMHQYTSHGRLDGWHKNSNAGNLDFDLFCGPYSEWLDLAKNGSPEPEPEPPAELKGPDPQVIADILDDRYGTLDARVKALTKAGYSPALCQQKVDELYNLAAKIRPMVEADLPYIDSIAKILKG